MFTNGFCLWYNKNNSKRKELIINIAVQNKSKNGKVFVRNLSYQKYCEQQLNEIIKEMEGIKKNLLDIQEDIREELEKYE